MTVERYLRTVDLARAAQISVQQVRNYEAGGFILPVARSPSGYRRYTPQHLAGLMTAVRLTEGYGWETAQLVMQAVNAGRVADALAHVDERHAALAAARVQLGQTLAALNVLTAQLPAAAPHHAERLLVSAAARLVAAPVSTLRFWEQQGLVQPVREPGSRYRVYDQRALRRLRIVALLRQAHYAIGAIRATLAELEGGEPQRAVAALEQRRTALAKISQRRLAALAALHGYVVELEAV